MQSLLEILPLPRLYPCSLSLSLSLSEINKLNLGEKKKELSKVKGGSSHGKTEVEIWEMPYGSKLLESS